MSLARAESRLSALCPSPCTCAQTLPLGVQGGVGLPRDTACDNRIGDRRRPRLAAPRAVTYQHAVGLLQLTPATCHPRPHPERAAAASRAHLWRCHCRHPNRLAPLPTHVPRFRMGLQVYAPLSPGVTSLVWTERGCKAEPSRVDVSASTSLVRPQAQADARRCGCVRAPTASAEPARCVGVGGDGEALHAPARTRT
eukprot:856877-Prymnesium_polylepis.2